MSLNTNSNPYASPASPYERGQQRKYVVTRYRRIAIVVSYFCVGLVLLATWLLLGGVGRVGLRIDAPLAVGITIVIMTIVLSVGVITSAFAVFRSKTGLQLLAVPPGVFHLFYLIEHYSTVRSSWITVACSLAFYILVAWAPIFPHRGRGEREPSKPDSGNS